MIPPMFVTLPAIILAAPFLLAYAIGGHLFQLSMIALAALHWATTRRPWREFRRQMLFAAPRILFFHKATLALLLPNLIACPCAECDTSAEFTIFRRVQRDNDVDHTRPETLQ